MLNRPVVLIASIRHAARYVMNRGILPDLPQQMRDEMTRFVQTELMGAPWTGWMRALAKRPVGHFRSDSFSDDFSGRNQSMPCLSVRHRQTIFKHVVNASCTGTGRVANERTSRSWVHRSVLKLAELGGFGHSCGRRQLDTWSGHAKIIQRSGQSGSLWASVSPSLI